MVRLVTFTNLFPSAELPTHGAFVADRMQRVAAASGLPWSVVAPVPAVVPWLRFGAQRRWARLPDREVWHGVDVQHPRYRHWPGFGMRRQAAAMVKGARAAVAALAAAEPIVLDAHYLWPDGVAAATLAAELGVPFTLTARGSDVNVLAADPVVRAGIAAAAARAAACWAVSGDLAARFADVVGLPRARVVEVRNGVDLEQFRPGDAAAARAELGLPATGRLLLGVGRLVPGKGFATAVAALPQLPDDVQLVLVGDGPERQRLLALAPGRVHCLGNRPRGAVATAYRAADLLVLPSEREGWPNVVTEALASGLRVLATPVGGIPEILDHPAPGDLRLGALTPVGDVAAFAAAALALLASPAEPLAVRAFAARYGWDEPVAVLAATFRGLLGVAAA